ncbi:MAG: hypothetical protein R2759_09860 [Bacteroidales bacterium]
MNSVHFSSDGQEEPVDALLNNENEIIITGYTESYGTGAREVYLMSIDTLGNQNYFILATVDLMPAHTINNHYENFVIAGWYTRSIC